jgi:hypothetical protein
METIKTIYPKTTRTKPEREKYIVYGQDLKYRHKREIDPKWAEWENEHVKEKFNIDHESIEYRMSECKNTGFKTLDLSEMNLIEIPPLNKDIISNIEHLFLNNNKLTGGLDIRRFVSLKIIDFSENDVTDLKANEGIEEIVCRKNKLTDIPKIKSIVRLDCSDNNITDVNITTGMKILICSGNAIKIINDSKTLNKLLCDKNPISSLGLFPNLVYLDMSQTMMTSVNNYKNLQTLILNGTKISKLPIFGSLETLEIINTDVDIVEFMPKLKSIICSVDKTKKISHEYDGKIDIKLHKGRFLVINIH